MAKLKKLVKAAFVAMGGILFIMSFFCPYDNLYQQFYSSKIETWRKLASNFYSTTVFETLQNKTKAKLNKRFEISNNHFNKANLVVSDELLQIKRKIIKPLHYSDLEESFRNLLAKRKCYSFPCKQVFQKDNFQDQFQIRNVIANESCKLTRHQCIPLKRQIFHLSMRGFGMCVIPKVGSRSWHQTQRNLLKHKFRLHNTSPQVITVRHPFDRLASAYRDKFMNGKPLTAFTEEYQNKTESHEGWIKRWRIYWLPALISSCVITPSRKYRTIFSIIVNTYQRLKTYCQKKTANFNDFYKLITDISNPNDSELFQYLINKQTTLTIPKIITKITIGGNNYGMEFFSKYGYNKIEEIDLIESMKNSTFSFQNFLEHVIWTYEIGLENYHWSTYQNVCGVCYKKYDYILHLNNIDEESKQFLSGVGYPIGTSIASKHRVSNNLNISTSHAKKLNTSTQLNYSNKYINYDTIYYQDIPQEIIEKLRNIYFRDLLIFGYIIP